MTDKQIIDEIEINPNDWLEPYKPIPACEIKDCDHLVYVGNDVYGCRIAEDGLFCDDFNNADECCMYRQLEYYKEALKAKEQECEELKQRLQQCWKVEYSFVEQLDKLEGENGELKKINNHIEHNRNQKADKLMRIEKLITTCSTGYTDEFIQELLVILHAPEPSSFENKYKATLAEIKELCQKHIKAEKIVMANDILQKISECEVENENTAH